MAIDTVLIHLGGRRPRHLAACAAQVATIAGRAPIVVGPIHGARMRSPRLARFRSEERLSDLGMGGFWRYAAERLLVLEELMRSRSLEHCLHLESDCLLYVDPASYEGWLAATYDGAIAICPLTDDEDTAAVMYVGSLGALEAFNDGLLELVALGPEGLLAAYGGPMANEMRMLRILRAERGLARALPVTVDDARALGAEVVFDPASYGQWVDGIPSRPGVPYAGEHHLVGREIIGGRVAVTWDAQQRRPSVTAGGATMPLANLHVHSKRLDRWTGEPAPPQPRRGPSPVARAAATTRRHLRAAHRRMR